MPFRSTFLRDDCLLLETDALNLIRLRNSYAYPRTYMRFSDEPTQFQLAPGVWAKPVHPRPYEVTDFQLDEYHSRLLLDPEPLERLLGCVSIIYWGYYTFKRADIYDPRLHELAAVRVQRFLQGTQWRPGTTADAIAVTLTAIENAKTPGAALGLLHGISGLGFVPFGSKIVSYVMPGEAGVMDEGIFGGLGKQPWAQNAFFLCKGSVRTKRTQDRYTAWCTFLCCIRDQLNAGIDAGKPWHWTDPHTHILHRWRAVDVERALFRDVKAPNQSGGCLHLSLPQKLMVLEKKTP